MDRNSFIFYRSWYEAIKSFPAEVQGEIYTAIMEYGLSGNETNDMGKIASAMWALIKPQMDVNNARYENGCKGGEYGNMGGAPKGNKNAFKKTTPKQPQNNPKTTPNVYDNDNVYDNEEKEKEKITKVIKKRNSGEFPLEPAKSDKFKNFETWIEKNAPNVSKLKEPFTEDQYNRIAADYHNDQIKVILLAMHNYKDLTKKYVSANLTFRKWAKKEYGQ